MAAAVGFSDGAKDTCMYLRIAFGAISFQSVLINTVVDQWV